MIVRLFQPRDAQALWDVFYSAIHQTAAADYTAEQLNAWAPIIPDPAQWALRMEGINPFVCEIDGRIVGYADLQPTGYIDHFFVSATAGQQGVGSALMCRIHERASEQRVRRLFSDVSLAARRFFEKFGFEALAAQTVCVRGVALSNFRMTKQMITPLPACRAKAAGQAGIRDGGIEASAASALV